MLSNYIKTASRNIIRHKLYSLINITGLAIGMACTIIIMLWVQDELSYDKFHKNADWLYRVIELQTYADMQVHVSVTPYPLAAALKEDYPEVIESARYNPVDLKSVAYGNKHFKESYGAAVDRPLLKMLTFDFLKGNPETALSEPYSIVISRKMSEKYFGKQNPIGKVLKVNNGYDLKVTGVIDDFPDNSHMRFNYIITFDTLFGISGDREFYPNRSNNSIYTYILLEKNADYRLLEQKIKGYIKTKDEHMPRDLILQPLTDIHLYSGSMGQHYGSGSIYNVYLFTVISVFILLISCINYICLTTARYTVRAKEVGIRKVSGARRTQLMMQFLCESLLITLLALIFSLCLVELFLPEFNTLSHKELAVNCFNNIPLFLIILITGLVTGLLSGFYPAFMLSGFKPGDVLKGPAGSNRKDIIFRKGMVYLQWILSIILIIGTWVTLRQFTFLKDKYLGFERNRIVYLEMDHDLKQKYESVKDEFLQDPKVISVTSCENLPNNIGNSTSGSDWEGKEGDGTFLFHFNSVDYDFIETFGLRLAEGRSFSREYSSDISNESHINFIINETAVKKMGLTDPVGKWFSPFGMKGTIIGVLKDFHFNELHYRISPLILYIYPEINARLAVKIDPENMDNTMDTLKKKLNAIIPGNIYEFRFFNDDFNRIYNSEKMTSKIIRNFACLGIFVAFLGLMALAGFMSEQRIKEIGIRKSLGASVTSIIFLMSKKYVKLIATANIIAWPFAWYFLNGWLNNYPYRIKMGWYPFVITGVIALVISQVIVGYYSIKAAVREPVKALKYE